MSTPWKKLNLKDSSEIVVVDAPESFESALGELAGTLVVRDLSSVQTIGFILAFVTRRREIEEIAARLGAVADGDALVWLAYPKKSSKRYSCDFHRDSGWEPLGRLGFEAVRQVAIDEDWSALRFRRTEFIKTMRRDPKRALSKAGRKKTTKG